MPKGVGRTPARLRFARHRNEHHRKRAYRFQSRRHTTENAQFLGGRAHGNRHQPADLQLLDQCRWHLRRRRRHHDAVVGRVLGPSVVPVASPHFHVAIAQLQQGGTRAFRKRCDDLDRVHRLHEPAENGGLVARSGADLEHPMDRFDLQRLCHEGHDIGLGNGLAVSDGQSGIAVSQRTRGFRNEHVPRHMEHRVQHARVMDVAGPELFIDHATALRLPPTVVARVVPVEARVGHQDHEPAEGEREGACGDDPVRHTDTAGASHRLGREGL